MKERKVCKVTNIFFLLFLLSVVIFLPSCTFSKSTRSSLPVVAVDSDHNFLYEHTGPIQTYEIPPGEGFLLDISGEGLQIPSTLESKNETHPNRVFIYLRYHLYAPSWDKYYYANWNDNKNILEISPNSLMEVGEQTKSFRGLDSGQYMQVIIGYIDEDEKMSEWHPFYPLWGASVYVK